MANEPTLRLLLSVPYLIEACTVESTPGIWVRRAAYPELPDCMAEAATIEGTLARLERRRVDVIVDLLKTGKLPPIPRPPLRDYDVEGLLHRLGKYGELTPFLDLPPSQWHLHR